MSLKVESYYDCNRLDGLVFYASSEHYCRPICNQAAGTEVTFNSAAAAEKAGYLPCPDCRPERAPFLLPSDPEDVLARTILCRIEEGVLNQQSVEAVAAEMGLTDRHMRRIVQRHCGASPIQIAQTYRLHLAKRLLSETNLTIAEISQASGFTSLRRFNSLFSTRYKCKPSKMRLKRSKLRFLGKDEINFELTYRAPYEFAAILDHLALRAFPTIEEVTEQKYNRSVSIAGCRGWLSVQEGKSPNTLRVTVSRSLVPVLLQVINRVKKLFDMAADPLTIANRLNDLAIKMPGLRIPGAFEPLEVAIKTIVSHASNENISSDLTKRLVSVYGDDLRSPFETITKSASSEQILDFLLKADLVKAGLSKKAANQLRLLADNTNSGKILLQPTPHVETLFRRLIAEGELDVCPATYISLRCLSSADSFPYSDEKLTTKVAQLFDDPDLKIVESWRPWRGYAAMQLYKLMETGLSDKPCELSFVPTAGYTN